MNSSAPAIPPPVTCRLPGSAEAGVEHLFHARNDSPTDAFRGGRRSAPPAAVERGAFIPTAACPPVGGRKDGVAAPASFVVPSSAGGLSVFSQPAGNGDHAASICLPVGERGSIRSLDFTEENTRRPRASWLQTSSMPRWPFRKSGKKAARTSTRGTINDCGGVDSDTQRNVDRRPRNITGVATGSLTGSRQKADWTSCASRGSTGPQSPFPNALACLLAVPAGWMFASLLLFIFSPSDAEKNFGAGSVYESIRTFSRSSQ